MKEVKKRKTHLPEFKAKVGLERISPFIHTVEAVSVEEAVEQLDSGRFDVVVSDWSAPGGGNELVKRLRSMPQHRYVTLIRIAGHNDHHDKIRAVVEMGVDAYVARPFTSQDLYTKIIASLDKRIAA